MRRGLRVALGAAVLVLAVQPPVSAAPEEWAGSKITSLSTSSEGIKARFVRAVPSNHRVRATTTVGAPAGLPGGCTASVGGTSVQRDGSNHDTSATLTTNCNGIYEITVTGILECAIISCAPFNTSDSHDLRGSITVREPAPPVAGTTAATGSDRSVTIAWTPVVGAPPDFLGYRVERVSASGTTVTLATIDNPTASSFTDTAPPRAGGPTTYRVYGRRAAPGGALESTPAVTTAEVPADPDAPADPDPADPGAPGDPGTPGGPSGSPSVGAPNSPRRGSGLTTTRRSGGAAVRVPRAGRPSQSFFPPLLSPPTTEDAGFSEELPFGDEEEEPGQAEAVLPDDALASGPFQAAPGRGLMVPAATGLVMAVWAMHLRFLARASKPRYVEQSELPELVHW